MSKFFVGLSENFCVVEFFNHGAILTDHAERVLRLPVIFYRNPVMVHVAMLADHTGGVLYAGAIFLVFCVFYGGRKKLQSSAE